MERNYLERLLFEHTDAWNSHDLDQLMSLFADNCVFEASAGPESHGRRFEGRAQRAADQPASIARYRSVRGALTGYGRRGAAPDRGVGGAPADRDLAILLGLSRGEGRVR